MGEVQELYGHGQFSKQRYVAIQVKFCQPGELTQTWMSSAAGHAQRPIPPALLTPATQSSQSNNMYSSWDVWLA